MADLNLNRTDSTRAGLSDSITALVQRTPTTAADFVLFSESIFPTEQDVAATPGDGITLREDNLAYWAAALCGAGGGGSSAAVWTFANRILTGCKLPPPTSLSLNLTVQAGRAWIGGYHLIVPATVITGTASFTNYVYLKLARNANSRVTSGVYEVNTTGVKPASSLYVGTAVCDGSQVTAVADKRSFGQTGSIGWTLGASDRTPDGTLPLDTTNVSCTTYENLFDLAVSNLAAAPWFSRGTALGTVTADSSTDKFTLASHGMSNGDVTHYSSTVTLPGGVTTLQKYFVVNKGTNDWQIAHTPGGTAIDITSAGSGVISAYNKFQLADLESRSVMSAGSGGGLRSRALGANGGFEDNTIANMTAHTHSQNTGGSGFTMVAPMSGSLGTSTTGSTGGGAADGNLTPFLTFTCYVWT